jgi:glycosyltransferase involved in cell wall biosynthesis
MYNNIVDRIISITNRPKKSKYDILTFPTHERYETQLCKTGHEFYSFSLNNTKKWNEKQTSIPSNYHILPESQICGFIEYDFILVQSKFWQYQVAQQINQLLSVPIVCLEHTTPTPQTINEQQFAEMKNMKGDVNVFISDFSKKKWQIDGIVIHHGLDTDKFAPSESSKKSHILTVANDFKNRDYCLNYSGWKRVTNGLETKLVGETEGLSKPASSVEELVNEYNDCGVYFNSSTLSPIPMSLLEAMSCGCAVVSTATCMIPEIIKNGENGFISNDEDELKKYILQVLHDEELRKTLGENARKTILEKFSESKFVDEWNKLFDKIYEVSTI